MANRSYILRYYTIILALLSSLIEMRAQNLSIQARLDRAEIRTGEQAVIDVTIRTDNLPQTQFFLLEDSVSAPRFRVLEFGALDTVTIGQGLQEVRAKMLITSFDSTLVTIPPIVVQTPTGQEMSEPLALRVVQPVVDASKPDDFEGIKSPWDEPYTLLDIVFIVLSSPITYIVLFLVCLLGGYMIYRRRRGVQEPIVVVQEDSRTPAELALQSLDQLEETKYILEEDYKGLYSRMVDILKVYLHETRTWEVKEMTTMQLLDFLVQEGVHQELRGYIRSVLHEADLAKFARYSCSLDEAKQTKEQVRQSILLSEKIYSTHQSASEE